MAVHEAVAVDGGRTLTRPECSEFEVRVALRRLQRRFDLRPSGRLDDETKRLMSRGRCGNTDADQPRQPETVLRHQAGSRRRRRRSTDESRDPVRVPLERRSAEMTSSVGSTGIDHADLHSRLVPGTEHEPGAALSRRTKMFLEMRERHRIQIAREAVQDGPAGRNHTEEELAAIRRRIREGRARRAGDQVPASTRHRRRRRRRRSISVPSFDDRVDEDLATDSTSPETYERVRFQKNANRPVRWRLLADGVSGKIPLIDQRAILELAFRMWSEVIPLKFHEANSIDIVNMDVVIAFAKREFVILITIGPILHQVPLRIARLPVRLTFSDQISSATLISDNSAVSVLTSILKQPVASLSLLSTL